MLQAYIDDLCVIGITRKNVEKLTMHQPMKIGGTWSGLNGRRKR